MAKKFAGIIINETPEDVDKSLYSTEPLGLEYALAAAQAEGWEVKLFDNMMFSGREEFLEAIKRYQPHVAGFSVFDNSRNSSLTVARALKEQKATTLFGGYHPSACPEIALKEEVDFVIAGEAERTLPKLLQSLDNYEQKPKIANLAYKENGKLHFNRENNREKERGNLPYYLPIRNQFYLRQKDTCLNYPAPSDQTGVAHISINRGCANRCYYCSSTSVYGNSVSKGNMEMGIREIEELRRRGVNLIIVDDLNFAQNERFAEEFYQKMRNVNSNSDTRLSFEVFGNVERTTSRIINLLYGAGVRKIGFGIESLNEEVLRFMRREVNFSKLKAILEQDYELGILTTCFYQVGYPQDTKDTINENFARLIGEQLFIPRIRISVATPTSGSPWYKQLKVDNPEWPREENWPMFDCEHLVYSHSSLKPEEIGALRNEMEKKYYQSDFYRRSLDLFVRKHPHLKKVFEECREKNE
ncbi:MAG: cobalamin-dependent protein [Nanoarchaeota archaeon]